MIVKAQSKSEFIEQELLKQIHRGNYSRGELLPSERNLAQNFNVSYMTARKAVDKLVKNRYLERIPGKGTFIRNDISERQMQKQIGIICPAWESPEVMDAILYASEAAELNNFLPKVVFSRTWDDKSLSDALENYDALIVIPPEPITVLPVYVEEKLKDSKKPVIIIGQEGYQLGFDTVMGHPEQEMTMALNLLKESGHTKIALIDQYSIENKMIVHASSTNYSVWQKFTDQEVPPEIAASLYFGVNSPAHTQPQKEIYRKLITYGKNLPFTAIVTSVYMVQGTMAALEDMGLRIPDDISIVAIGDRQEVEFYRPKLTHIRVSTREHMVLALAAIKKRLDNPALNIQYLPVEAEIIKGQTIDDV